MRRVDTLNWRRFDYMLWILLIATLGGLLLGVPSLRRRIADVVMGLVHEFVSPVDWDTEPHVLEVRDAPPASVRQHELVDDSACTVLMEAHALLWNASSRRKGSIEDLVARAGFLVARELAGRRDQTDETSVVLCQVKRVLTAGKILLAGEEPAVQVELVRIIDQNVLNATARLRNAPDSGRIADAA